MIQACMMKSAAQAAGSRGCLARGWSAKTNRDRRRHPDRWVVWS